MNKDQTQRFLFEDFDVRGELVQLPDASQDVLFNRDYPEPIADLLAEMIPAVCLLSASLKFEGSLILQAQNTDPLIALMAECTHDMKFRAIAKWDKANWGEKLEAMQSNNTSVFKFLLGNGNLTITVAPSKGKQYQGIVPLEQNTLAACIEDYFVKSEQLPTRIYLGKSKHSLAGMLIQRLPQAKGTQSDFQHIQMLADTVKQEELTGLEANTILHRLFHQESIRLYPPTRIVFSCSCSKERTSQALLTLSDDEYKELLEKEKDTFVTCEFCGKIYTFDKVDLKGLQYRHQGHSDTSSKKLH